MSALKIVFDPVSSINDRPEGDAGDDFERETAEYAPGNFAVKPLGENFFSLSPLVKAPS